MITDHDRAMAQLHTRSVRGEQLNADEQERLTAWYAAQDTAEAVTLRLTSHMPVDLLTLQRDVDSALTRLEQATRDVQELAQQNAALRQRITVLEARLRERMPSAAPLSLPLRMRISNSGC